MQPLEIIFWILLLSVFYAYAGYGFILWVFVSIFRRKKQVRGISGELPEITLFITAYNEKDYVDVKMRNCRELIYPPEKLKIVWVTDGSDDGTPELLKDYPEVQVFHEPERRGKIAAMNRGMQFVTSPLVVFCDANTLLNQEALLHITEEFSHPNTGCVAGEKRIISQDRNNAASSGEGLYWKYESMLKKWDARLHSAVGGAGELFAIRRDLFREVEPDTLLDDFVISLRIVEMGYRIAYSPDAFASETSSANIKEEMKRKIRIAAGGIQSVFRLGNLLNPFKYGVFAWQFLSHKVMRWLWVPFMLPVILAINILIVLDTGFDFSGIYSVMLALQGLFYFFASFGWLMRNKKIGPGLLFAPYYVFVMNYSVYLGIIRYFRGKQTVNWERAKRA